MPSQTGLTFAYYCSGHGFGHATRVSAFASHLLSLDPKPTVHIVSSAPKYVFSDSVAAGALYRSSDIDPVIVQPLAYRVDRQKSVDVLKAFLEKKDAKLEEERRWLTEIKADCVLSDAAFLGCLAANAAGLPSILITNFTFDSVFSYLSAPLTDDSTSDLSTSGSELSQLQPPAPNIFTDMVPDIPIPQSILAPLVDQIHAGYRCANLLMLLPGAIPIPSFTVLPSLPSPDWIDWKQRVFKEDVQRQLVDRDCGVGANAAKLHPTIPFLSPRKIKPIPRRIINAPLLVRFPTGDITCATTTNSDQTLPSRSPYTQTGRSALLSSIGVPSDLHDPEQTKILVVSFGGQVFKRVGSRNASKRTSRSASPAMNAPTYQTAVAHKENLDPNEAHDSKLDSLAKLVIPQSPSSSSVSSATSPSCSETDASVLSEHPKVAGIKIPIVNSPRLATSSHIFIPGAPPASKPQSAPNSPLTKPVSVFQTNTIPPSQPGTPRGTSPQRHRKQTSSISSLKSYFQSFAENVQADIEEADEPRGLLPDESWVAIVCGVSKEQWNAVDGDENDGLPDGFYVAPKDVYMPDLTAIADVLLGKLGYGTVAECVDSCTPFVYVSRPLFVEEHGLRLLLSRSGVGIELSRNAYEAGEWAAAVEAAWLQGRERKSARNKAGAAYGQKRVEEGRDMARKVVSWVGEWVQ